MESERQAETTARLATLIDLLQEEAGDDAPAPPPNAAASWSEAAVRRFFATGEAPAGAGASDNQPGGGVAQPKRSDGDKPDAMTKAQAALTAAHYRSVAFATGIPFLPHGLFEPDDAVLKRLASDTSLRPFGKLLVGRTGELELAAVSFPVGDDAAQHRGIDLRYFYDVKSPKGTGAKLTAAVVFGDRAAIGAGYFTSVHGGALETVFDESTAELVKANLAPLASTIEFSAAIKKPVPLHTTLLLECSIESVTSGGLRINTVASLKDGAVVLATCKAQLVDVGRLQRAAGSA
jgi:hypothetical protein